MLPTHLPILRRHPHLILLETFGQTHLLVGTPARIIRYRFDEGMIHRLEKIKWWNYPAEYLLALDFSDIKKCVEELEKTPGSARATYREICLTREGMSILDQ